MHRFHLIERDSFNRGFMFCEILYVSMYGCMPQLSVSAGGYEGASDG